MRSFHGGNHLNGMSSAQEKKAREAIVCPHNMHGISESTDKDKSSIALRRILGESFEDEFKA